MLYAIIADIHSNLEALTAVIKDIEDRAVERILFLGDAVGYGPNPNECVQTIKERAFASVAGNHDWGLLGLTDIDYFNPSAQAAIIWSRDVTRVSASEYLRGLPLTMSIKENDIFIVHSTPKEPERWHYLLYYEDAEENFPVFKEKICFLGHSHIPFILERLPTGKMQTLGKKARLSKEARYIVNPGSVGQPRDGDPRASYALFDGSTLEIVRVEYPLSTTQKKMRAAGLPLPLIERLSVGR